MRTSTLLFICALALSATAAYYSIIGLATIFSSAFVPVIVMAGILEISKLVVASWLYQKWDMISGPIKAYLTSAVLVLMLITSIGIFGFLSKAHVEQNLNNDNVALQIEQIDTQISSVNEIIQRYRSQLEQLDRSISVQLDSNRAAQALAARQRQAAERDQIRQRLDAEQQRLQDLNRQKITLRQQITALESEVGPIRYVAEFFSSGNSVDLEKSVRWMIVILVLVFDPLAVLMLIAANMSFEKENQTEPVVSTSNEQTVVLPADPGPKIGDVVYIDGRPLRWWNGASWEKMDDNDGVAPEKISNLVEQGMNAWLEKSLSTVPTVDPEEIRRLVKTSMDEWLTKTTEQAHHQTDDSNEPPITEQDIKSDPVPEVIQKDPEILDSNRDLISAKKPESNVQRIEPKPSWL